MLLTLDKETLATGDFTSSRDRETDYKIQSVLNAPIITPEAYEELKTKTKAGNTTHEDTAKCNTDYYQGVLALEELTGEAIKPFMYNEDIIRNSMRLIDIKHHHSEYNLKSVKFRERERAATANTMINV